jgi:hypothetical protein
MLKLFLFLIGCTTDVSIIKTNEPDAGETGVVDDIDTSDKIDDAVVNEPTDDTDQPVDLTNVVGFAGIHFRQIACPACVGETGEFDVTAELKLHYPTSGDYLEYMTPVGTCTTTLFNTYVSSQPLAATQSASFNGIQLQPAGQGTWVNNYLYEYEYLRNTPHTITSEHGVVTNAFQTVEGFDSISPYTLLWVDPSYAFEPVISKSGTVFSWSPILSGDQFEVVIAVYSPDGSQFLGAVSCMQQDTGSITVPGNYFAGYPYWSLAAVHFIRHRVADAVSVELGGRIQTHMQWEVVGTAHVE